MNLPERDGDGYLIDMSQWTPEIGRAMANADSVELDDTKWQQILKARDFFEEQSVVPPIRKFSKYCGEDQNGWKLDPFRFLGGDCPDRAPPILNRVSSPNASLQLSFC
jgi:TusE/DsrC/DsvC family sulfur relay protein